VLFTAGATISVAAGAMAAATIFATAAFLHHFITTAGAATASPTTTTLFTFHGFSTTGAMTLGFYQSPRTSAYAQEGKTTA